MPWVPGKLTAVARDSAGKVVATMERHTNGKAAKLELSIDAPAAATGTGTAVLLDGHDAALLRASVVDDNGRVMHLATNNITFRVVSGPGVVQGTGNGDPHCHEPNNAPWHSAYHGLVRGVIKVTSAAARDPAERALIATIDRHGPLSAGSAPQDHADIVVEVSSPGERPHRTFRFLCTAVNNVTSYKH